MFVALKNKITHKNILIAILVLAFVLRLYKLGNIPPSLSWDEAAVGYNAYSIANFGKDEWGNVLPLVFKSFEDDKNPVHVYFTAISVFIFDLSEFSIRLPSAIFGVLNVLLIYYLGEIFFQSIVVGLIAALFLAISPFGIQFSRFNHEANFALFFFMLGLVLFYSWLVKEAKRNWFLPLSFLSLGLSILSYHSSKIVVPPVIILLIVFYLKDLLKNKKYFLIGIAFFGLVSSLFLLNPALLGTARINQTSIGDSVIRNTNLYKKTGNELLGKIEVVADQYISHYSTKYLFLSGDNNSRHSTQKVGEFYQLDVIFLTIGGLFLFWGVFTGKIELKKFFIFLSWIILAPLPASLTQEAPHAARALFMMGSLHLVSAYGFYKIIESGRKPHFKVGIAMVGIIILGIMVKNYLTYYYQNYSKQSATEWQYGMKQIVNYVSDHPEYNQVFMTDIRSQPYIFFLYYLKTPAPRFLETVNYNFKPSRSYNLVSSFGGYSFGGWDPIESMPTRGVLYIVTSSHYDGLRHKDLLKVKDIINYPDGSVAFYLVSSQ